MNVIKVNNLLKILWGIDSWMVGILDFYSVNCEYKVMVYVRVGGRVFYFLIGKEFFGEFYGVDISFKYFLLFVNNCLWIFNLVFMFFF